MKLSELSWLDKIYKNINFANLPHGIIINGPEGVGKEILALHIAKKLLLNTPDDANNKLFDSDNHPDFFYLNKDKILISHITYRDDKWDDEKGKRNLIDFLSTTSAISKNKVALVNNAQTMNIQSQNALLKSLEEPPSKSYIIMTTNRSKCLLDTIYSRCCILNIACPTSYEIDNWLVDNGIADIKAKNFPSFITPLKILNEIENNKHLNFKDFIEAIIMFLNNKNDTNLTLKKIISLEIDLITKVNFLVEFLKILVRSNLLSEELSGIYKELNNTNFSNLKVSNLIDELNNLRYDFFKVPQINETHVLNYFLSELKNSIKLS